MIKDNYQLLIEYNIIYNINMKDLIEGGDWCNKLYDMNIHYPVTKKPGKNHRYSRFNSNF